MLEKIKSLQKQQLILTLDAATVTWPAGRKAPKTKHLVSLTGAMTDYGIDDDFIKTTREKVTEGTSALFLLTTGAIGDKVAEALKGQQFELIASNLTKEQEEELMAVFSAE